MQKIKIAQYGVICALGKDKISIRKGLYQGRQEHLRRFELTGTADSLIVAEVPDSWLEQDNQFTRNNRLVLAALRQIEDAVKDAVKRYGAERVGIVLGTSTSGISHGEVAVNEKIADGQFPEEYDYAQQEMGDPAFFVAEYFGIEGPSYCISTACSSSGKAFASAKQLINSGLCDAIICGGADSLCQLTTQGFSALEAVSAEKCNPFSVNRDGINIGEGAALFLLEKGVDSSDEKGVFLAGCGESSDAHHISAPEPEGSGAVVAMQAALKDANITAADIDYLNCHGTATPLNDSMESKAIAKVLGSQTPCSSTKPLTGHALGAAAAIEAAICCLILEKQEDIPAMVWDKQIDPELPVIQLLKDVIVPGQLNYVMSNSFAFGGSNVSVILGYQ